VKMRKKKKKKKKKKKAVATISVWLKKRLLQSNIFGLITLVSDPLNGAVSTAEVYIAPNKTKDYNVHLISKNE
jgi:hypothetical protein